MEYLSPEDGRGLIFTALHYPDLAQVVEDCIHKTRQLPQVYVHGDLQPQNV